MLVILFLIWIVALLVGILLANLFKAKQSLGIGVMLSVLFTLAILLIFPKVLTVNEKEDITTPPVAQSQPATQPELPQTKEQAVAQMTKDFDKIPNLQSAIDTFKPFQGDTPNQAPAIFSLFAFWHDKVDTSIHEIKSLPSTTYGKIMKDSTAEYGKHICVKGVVIEITANNDKTLIKPTYSVGIGQLSNGNPQVFRAIAVGDTGDLVQNSMATFCGVVIGTMSYSNSGGGTTHSPYLFGMFDLPANK